MPQVKHKNRSERRARSIRSKLHGTADRPRLSVYRSNKHISVQLIDDDKGIALMGVADEGKETIKGTKMQKASLVAKELAQKMKKSKISKIVFDRGPYRYHGRVKALAEVLREQGIDF